MNFMPSDYQVNAYRNIRMAHQLLRVIGLFEAEGIRYLAYKGPALAVQAYEDLSAREFCDLDVLISTQDFSRAYTILLDAGFVPQYELPAERRGLWPRLEKELSFGFQGITVELHTGVARWGELTPLSADLFWQDPQVIDILGQRVVTLGVRAAIWAACMHGFIHQWSQVKWVADLAALCQVDPDMDWFELLDTARKYGFQRMVSASLLLAADPGGVQFPPDIGTRLREDPRALELADLFRRNLAERFLPPNQNNFNSYYLRGRERLRDRIPYLLDFAFVPRGGDYFWFPLPAWLFPLYAVLRPLRLFWKYGIVRNLAEVIASRR